MDIDFRSSAWAPADGVDPYTVTYTGFSVTADSTGVDAGLLYQDAIDGLGVRGDENDEIDDYERIKITFNSHQLLDGVWITDLFEANDGINGEMGRVNLYDGGSLVDSYLFSGNDADQNNGELYVDFGGQMVTSAFFFVVNDGDKWYKNVGESGDNEFSIAGFNTAPVPEPATMMLFGLGLLGLAGVARRKK